MMARVPGAVLLMFAALLASVPAAAAQAGGCQYHCWQRCPCATPAPA